MTIRNDKAEYAWTHQMEIARSRENMTENKKTDPVGRMDTGNG